MLVVLDIYCKEISLGAVPAGCLKPARTYICLQGHNSAEWPSFLIPVNVTTLDLINVRLGKGVCLAVRSGKSLLVPTNGEDIAISMSLLQDEGDGSFTSICSALTSVRDLAQQAALDGLALDERKLSATDFAGNTIAALHVLLKAEVTSESIQPFLEQQLQQQKSLQTLAAMVQTKPTLTADDRSQLYETLLRSGVTAKANANTTERTCHGESTRAPCAIFPPRSVVESSACDRTFFRPPLVGFDKAAVRTIFVSPRPIRRGSGDRSLRTDEFVAEKLSSSLLAARIPRMTPIEVRPLPEQNHLQVAEVEVGKRPLEVDIEPPQMPVLSSARLLEPTADISGPTTTPHFSSSTVFKPLSKALRAKIAAANEKQRLDRRRGAMTPAVPANVQQGANDPPNSHTGNAAPLNETGFSRVDYSSIRRSGHSDSILSAPLASSSPTLERSDENKSVFAMSQSNSLFMSGLLATIPGGANKLTHFDAAGQVSTDSICHGTTELSAISGVSAATNCGPE
jgi:hypothetical protein